jgi:predicted site-specific integrase-resolvase
MYLNLMREDLYEYINEGYIHFWSNPNNEWKNKNEENKTKTKVKNKSPIQAIKNLRGSKKDLFSTIIGLRNMRMQPKHEPRSSS